MEQLTFPSEQTTSPGEAQSFHVTDGETEAERDLVICIRSHT